MGAWLYTQVLLTFVVLRWLLHPVEQRLSCKDKRTLLWDYLRHLFHCCGSSSSFFIEPHKIKYDGFARLFATLKSYPTAFVLLSFLAVMSATIITVAPLLLNRGLKLSPPLQAPAPATMHFCLSLLHSTTGAKHEESHASARVNDHTGGHEEKLLGVVCFALGLRSSSERQRLYGVMCWRRVSLWSWTELSVRRADCKGRRFKAVLEELEVLRGM